MVKRILSIIALLLVSNVICVLAQNSTNQWEAEIAAFEQMDRENPPPKGAVIFTGSSSIRLWKSLEQDFPGVKVVNRGFGGSQVSDSVRFVDRILIPHRPRMILLYAGDNDIAAGKTPETVLDDFRSFVKTVHASLPRTRIGYLAIKPSPARWHLVDQMRKANKLIKDYASKDRQLIFIDVHTPMIGADGMPRPELYVEDKLHMSPEGYRLWTSVVGPYLR